MLRKKTRRLGSALLVMAGIGSMNYASASHWYNIEVSVYQLPDDSYSIVVFPPLGLAPNSVCMQDWQTPSGPTNIDLLQQRYFYMNIRDKDATPCSGNPKYNTWRFEVRKWSGAIGSSVYQVLGQGRFQFIHQKTNHDWYTQITALSADKDNPNDQPGLVKKAYCVEALGKIPPLPLQDCLGEGVKGENAANSISVYLGYPAS